MQDLHNDVAAVNHNGANYELGRGTNCLYCTTAYEMRRRGYDVQAQQDWVGGIRGDMPEAMFEGAHKDLVYDISGSSRGMSDEERAIATAAGSQAMIDAMVAQGDGARGYVSVQWAYGQGGHSMAYEVVNGKAIMIDCQTGETMTGNSIWEERLYYADTCSITRVDNCEFNKYMVDRYIEDAGTKDSDGIMDEMLDHIIDKLKKKKKKKKKKSKSIKKQVNQYGEKAASILRGTKRKASKSGQDFISRVKDVI
jgi:hypothetical protein